MNSFINKYVRPYLKAHAAGLGTAVTLLITDTHGNLNNFGNLTSDQWVGVVVASGLLGGLVGYLKNVPAPADPPAAMFSNPQDSAEVAASA